ncbi:MAG TPA: hypothetical protein VLM40_03600 [Gemmata sp.]|nr:hypothetical protein [Gemmata sp.]
MRLLLALVVMCCLAGCNYETNYSSESTVTNPDGSTTKVRYETKTRNGVKTETKTETTMKAGTITTVTFDKKGDQWVKRE